MTDSTRTLAELPVSDLAVAIGRELIPGGVPLREWQAPCLVHQELGPAHDDAVRARLLHGELFPDRSLNKHDTWELEGSKSAPASESQRLIGILWRLGGTSGERLFGVADPLASMVTLVLRAPREGSEALSRDIERYVHCYFIEARTLERKLTQRPSLQIVLLADESRGNTVDRWTFAGLAQKLVRRLGDASFDIQLRRVVDKTGQGSATLRAVLSAHGGGLIRDVAGNLPADAGDAPSPKEHIDIAIAQIDQFLADTTASLWDRTRLLLGRSVDSMPSDIPDEFSARPPLGAKESPPQSLLVRLAYPIPGSPERDICLPLAPITLVASDNASGKTTAIEAISSLCLDRPRLRAFLPDGAIRGNSPLLGWRLSTGGEVESGEGRTRAQTVLPLFADDLELHRGRPGETTIVSLAASLDNDARRSLFGLLQKSDALFREFNDVANGLQGNDDLFRSSGAGVADACDKYATWRALGDLFLEYRADDTSDQWRPIRIVDELRLFLSWLDRRGKFEEPGIWDALLALARHAGARAQLCHRLALLADERRSRLEHRLQSFLESLAGKVSTHQARPDALVSPYCDYLDVSPELAAAEDRPRGRPNTAQQVRRGFALRLSCWLSNSQHELPILAIDEAVFGQDSAAATASLGRFLRLHRIHSGLRWQRGIIHSATHLELRKDEQESEGIVSRVLEGRPRGLPLPPQIILTSHLGTSLIAAADAEGVILDLDIQSHLRNLVPGHWQAQVCRTLRQILGRTEFRAISPIPTPLLRLFLSEIVGNASPEPRKHGSARAQQEERDAYAKCLKDWWEKLPKSLLELGLSGLKCEIDEVTAGKVDDEEVRCTIARRLLAWMIGHDLLSAILSDGSAMLDLSGIALRLLPAGGGLADEIGPTRLRRLGAWLQTLPPDPLAPAHSAEGEMKGDAMPAQADESQLPDQTPVSQTSKSFRSDTDEESGPRARPVQSAEGRKKGDAPSDEDRVAAPAQADGSQSPGQTPVSQTSKNFRSDTEGESGPRARPVQSAEGRKNGDAPSDEGRVIATAEADGTQSPDQTPILETSQSFRSEPDEEPGSRAPVEMLTGPAPSAAAAREPAASLPPAASGPRPDDSYDWIMAALLATGLVAAGAAGWYIYNNVAPPPPERQRTAPPNRDQVWRVSARAPTGVALRAIEEAIRTAGMLPEGGDSTMRHVEVRFEALPVTSDPGSQIRLRGQLRIGEDVPPISSPLLGPVNPKQEEIAQALTEWLALGEDGGREHPRSSANLPIPLRDLARLLIQERLLDLPDGPVVVGLWSYIPDEVADSSVAFTFGFCPHEGQEPSQRELLNQRRIIAGLELLRRNLGGTARKALRFHSKCLPGLAIRAGSLFHHVTGYKVEVVQSGALWGLDRQPAAEAPDLSVNLLEAADAGVAEHPGRREIHFLLSFAQDVGAGYDRWRRSHPPAARSVELRPPQGPSRDAVSRENVAALGERIAAEMIREKNALRGLTVEPLIRIFIAAPNALAVSVGRSLNAVGEIAVMDWDKEQGTYLETLRFRA